MSELKYCAYCSAVVFEPHEHNVGEIPAEIQRQMDNYEAARKRDFIERAAIACMAANLSVPGMRGTEQAFAQVAIEEALALWEAIEARREPESEEK